MTYMALPFRDFESYLRIGRFMNADDIQLILKRYISKYVTYEISRGNYSINDISEVVYAKTDGPGTLQLEYDDIIMKIARFNRLC